jgi:hypothetical protein
MKATSILARPEDDGKIADLSPILNVSSVSIRGRLVRLTTDMRDAATAAA